MVELRGEQPAALEARLRELAAAGGFVGDGGSGSAKGAAERVVPAGHVLVLNGGARED
jgi:hypothetical protein